MWPPVLSTTGVDLGGAKRSLWHRQSGALHAANLSLWRASLCRCLGPRHAWLQPIPGSPPTGQRGLGQYDKAMPSTRRTCPSGGHRFVDVSGRAMLGCSPSRDRRPPDSAALDTDKAVPSTRRTSPFGGHRFVDASGRAMLGCSRSRDRRPPDSAAFGTDKAVPSTRRTCPSGGHRFVDASGRAMLGCSRSRDRRTPDSAAFGTDKAVPSTRRNRERRSTGGGRCGLMHPQ